MTGVVRKRSHYVVLGAQVDETVKRAKRVKKKYKTQHTPRQTPQPTLVPHFNIPITILPNIFPSHCPAIQVWHLTCGGSTPLQRRLQWPLPLTPQHAPQAQKRGKKESCLDWWLRDHRGQQQSQKVYTHLLSC